MQLCCLRTTCPAWLKVAKWADENGFRLSPQESTCILFTNKIGIVPDPGIELCGTTLAVCAEQKFLGIILDSKLTFIPQIKYLKVKCLKTMNLLKLLSRTTWGSDRKCILNLYMCLVGSRLDYGAIVYQSAVPSALNVLDPVHQSASGPGPSGQAA